MRTAFEKLILSCDIGSMRVKFPLFQNRLLLSSEDGCFGAFTVFFCLTTYRFHAIMTQVLKEIEKLFGLFSTS